MSRTERNPKIPEKALKEEKKVLKNQIKQQKKTIRILENKVKELQKDKDIPEKKIRPKKNKKAENTTIDKKQQLIDEMKKRFGKKK